MTAVDITAHCHASAVIALALHKRLVDLGRQDIADDRAGAYSYGAFTNEVNAVLEIPWIRRLLNDTPEFLPMEIDSIVELVDRLDLSALIAAYDAEKTEERAMGDAIVGAPIVDTAAAKPSYKDLRDTLAKIVGSDDPAELAEMRAELVQAKLLGAAIEPIVIDAIDVLIASASAEVKP